LAPVQCVTWGHPVTTGIPAIDYFISSRDLEADEAVRAQDHYSERLVRLNALPTYLYPVPDSAADMCPDLSFARGRTIYTCVQHPLKFHPDFDRTLIDILRRDPNGILILLDLYPHLTERLLARLTRGGSEVRARIHILPRLAPGAFFELLKASHVILDTFPFSGGVSSAEALGLGKIVVTWPHPDQMPGRVSYAYYRQMGLDVGVARDLDHYVDIAVRFGTDARTRGDAEHSIRDRARRLFNDGSVLREFEAFFHDARSAV
jgi:predicted O-linked N-acetylglucosamine transferase (SPINDLY family)